MVAKKSCTHRALEVEVVRVGVCWTMVVLPTLGSCMEPQRFRSGVEMVWWLWVGVAAQ